MINIIKVDYIKEYTLRMLFSNETMGTIDFNYLVNRDTTLTKSLKDISYFKSYFIDFGALCWKNGLELSGEGLYLKAKENKTIQNCQNVA